MDEIHTIFAVKELINQHGGNTEIDDNIVQWKKVADMLWKLSVLLTQPGGVIFME